MSLAGIVRDETYLSKQGSAYMSGRAVTSTGAESGGDTNHDFGFLAEFTYERTENESGEEDVAGKTHNNTTKTEAKLHTKIMQRDEKHINLPKNHTGYTRIIAEATEKKLGSGANMGQVFIVCAAKLPVGFKLDMKDLYPSWDWTCNPNATGDVISEDLSDFTGSLGAGVGTASIGAGEYEVFKEFAYA